MRYTMTTPCHECPFVIGSAFRWRRLVELARGEFACHKACDLNGDGVYEARDEETPHCAGALIFLEQMNRPHQMMRICERLGLYDATKLNMKANVGRTPADYRLFKHLAIQARKAGR